MSLDHKIFSASGRSPSAHPSHPSASDHQNRRRPPPGPDRLPIPGRRAPVRRGHLPGLLVTCGGTLCAATAFTRSRRCRPRSPIYIPAPSLSAGAHQAPAPPFLFILSSLAARTLSALPSPKETYPPFRRSIHPSVQGEQGIINQSASESVEGRRRAGVRPARRGLVVPCVSGSAPRRRLLWFLRCVEEAESATRRRRERRSSGCAASVARQDGGVEDAGAGGGPLPLHPGQGEDRAGGRHEPAAPPLLRVHQHHVPVGAVPRRHDGVLPQLPVLRRHLLQVLRRLLGRPALGEADPRVRRAEAAPRVSRRGRDVGARHGRRGLRGHPLLPRPPQARRRRGRRRQLQRLLRPVAEEGAQGAARLPRGVRRRGRHQRRPPPGQALRCRALHPRAPPRRAGRRALRHGEPGVVRALQRRRPRHAPRGLQGRRPAAGHRLGLLLLRLRPQRQGPLLGARPHRPAGLTLRGHQEGRRGDHAHVQPHLRTLHHRPPLLHRVRALGPPRHGLLLLHPQHPSGEAHHGLPRQGPRGPGPRLHLHRRYCQGLPRLPGNGRQEHRHRRQEARAGALQDLQPRQHLSRYGAQPGVHPGEAPPRQGQEERGRDARQRRRALHARQHLPSQGAARVQTHHQPGRRPQEVCQVVPVLLRLHQGRIQELATLIRCSSKKNPSLGVERSGGRKQWRAVFFFSFFLPPSSFSLCKLAVLH
uniref:Uncharacterized protein n=2 Tax=Zea mays TaxID=4577 RepID=A0A804NX02_MAIZE